MFSFSTIASKATYGYKTLSFILIVLFNTSAFSQAGTTILYEDQFGPVTLNYNGLNNGKHSYLGADGTEAYWTGSRWDIKYPVNDILYYSNTLTAMNPPHLSIGNWQIGPNSGMALIKFEGSGTTSTVLPVELMAFDAQTTEGGKSLLKWATASESNNAGFDIEASQDGVRFEKIGFVKGNGTTNGVKTYSFTDEKVASGLTYYRLKQVDIDGRFEYSKVISVLRKSDKFNAISVSPNPANDVLNIVVETKNDDDLEINLLDVFGETIKQQKTATQQGLNTKSLNLQDLPNGIYFLHLQQGTERIIRKIIKK